MNEYFPKQLYSVCRKRLDHYLWTLDWDLSCIVSDTYVVIFCIFC